ncbi:MAG: shikimate dehydrogenase [Dehalococcoidia bacterium]|nr:shikimate dehydrogenase [Dehalococcoidia bacterium]MSQ16685.1 shikimate dehydrogenase [Dehalococcoidia bacterium]
MTSILGIIGYPIGHSISAAFQQAGLDACGIDATYSAWEVPPSQIPVFIRDLRRPDVLGINVTVPHKEAVIPHLDEVDDWATEAGAVNTIVHRQGRLTGHNTDGYGFLRALREARGFSPQGRRALVLGAGGSARAVVLALVRDGVGRLAIANRTPERAKALAKLSERRGVTSLAISLTGPEIAAEAGLADLIVNCTSLGMFHGPGEESTPLSSQQIPAAALVYDLVYNPAETPLLREAARSGARTLGGLYMLVYQGAAAFEMWTGQPAPVDVMLQSAEKAMAARRAS